MSFLMLRDLASFIQERYALKATLPLAFLLSLGPLCLTSNHTIMALAMMVWVFLLLLILRIIDDIASIEADKKRHPHRKIINGRVSIKRLLWNTVWMAALVFLIAGYLNILWLTLGLALFYGLYFLAIKPHKLIILDPYFINLVFFFIPMMAIGISKETNSHLVITMAFFYWTATVAHDYAHSVEKQNPLGFPFHATYCYLINVIVGVFLAYQLDSSMVFLGVLMVFFLRIAWQLKNLLQSPDEATAKVFYTLGYVYFLAPIFALFIENKLSTVFHT